MEAEFGNTYFKKGYKSFVMGGREFATVNKKKIVVSDPSLEPYDYLTKEQKEAWKRGVKFAKEERMMLRALK